MLPGVFGCHGGRSSCGELSVFQNAHTGADGHADWRAYFLLEFLPDFLPLMYFADIMFFLILDFRIFPDIPDIF